MEGPLCRGPSDWTVEVVGSPGYWKVVSQEREMEPSEVEFQNRQEAVEFAAWMNRFEDMKAHVEVANVPRV